MLSNFVSTAIVNTTALLGLLLIGCVGARRGDTPMATPNPTTDTATNTTPTTANTAPNTTANTTTNTPTAAALAATSRVAGAAAGGPRLRFELGAMKEHTGQEFGLEVPMLLLTLRNSGREPIDVPMPGVDLIVSLRVSLQPLRAGQKAELRGATLLRPWTVQLAPLPPEEPIRQGLSPLSLKRDDVALLPGRYRVAVCVPPSAEAPYPSRFTDLYGGQCSNEIEIEIESKRRQRR